MVAGDNYNPPGVDVAPVQGVQAGAPAVQPTIESIHRDIALANSYRMELIKLVLTISAALLAFTVTFRPTLDVPRYQVTMWIAWAALAVSMVGGMVHMMGWDHYYKSYRDFDYKFRNDPDPDRGSREGRAKRKTINIWRRIGMVSQYGGLVIGVACVGLFAGINLSSMQKPAATTLVITVPAVSASGTPGVSILVSPKNKTDSSVSH